MNVKIKVVIAILLVIIGVIARLMPHAWNVAPMAAIALFSGAFLGKKYALFVPIIALLLSDIVVGFYDWKLALSVYSSYALIGLIGIMIGKKPDMKNIFVASLVGSLTFFFLTNWSFWQFSSWYAHTGHGLLACYVQALPFFRNTIVGDLSFNFILFGAYGLISNWANSKYALAVKTRN